MLKLNHIDVWLSKNHILNDISCEVQKGDFIVIVGTNGAGKTTFFDTVAGKIKPTSGTITLDGKDITHLDEQACARDITRLFQKTDLNSVGSFTVWQNLAMAEYSRRTARLADGMASMPKELAISILEQLGMQASLLEKPMLGLSGGQRQLISFAMATRLIPKLLLLDEPTAALDPQAATRLLQFAGQFIKKHAITTLLITHDPHIALTMGNKIWILEDGRITKQYDAQEKRNLHPDKLIGQIDYAQISV